MNSEFFLNLFFPRRCPVCGEIVEPPGGLICPECCLKLSPVKNPTCKKCGKEIADQTVEYCADCARRPRSFERGIALFNYNEAARHSMAQIKYGNKREYLDFYGEAMAVRYGRAIGRMGVDAIVPTPVHSSRRRARGFNQTEVLAEVLGKRLHIPVCPDALLRTKRTQPQKDLSAAERLKNLSGAFIPGKIPAGVETVLLVDDIYTTGSTIEACARALKKGGVSRIYTAVICMTQGR